MFSQLRSVVDTISSSLPTASDGQGGTRGAAADARAHKSPASRRSANTTDASPKPEPRQKMSLNQRLKATVVHGDVNAAGSSPAPSGRTDNPVLDPASFPLPPSEPASPTLLAIDIPPVDDTPAPIQEEPAAAPSTLAISDHASAAVPAQPSNHDRLPDHPGGDVELLQTQLKLLEAKFAGTSSPPAMYSLSYLLHIPRCFNVPLAPAGRKGDGK